ncbi:excalibur calcium-binding domain-containing protein [Actinocrispum sp. NPDC049592]|uniref:excalibur calcium-binding domain-containing protein n=1 Tax=Actinocrispum sp. NPDC049592 TaxID=3154835 RepID=UPI003427311A
MAGRQWHWVAAGLAVLAVFAAVLLNDSTPGTTISAQTFPTVAYREPDNGGMIIASPTMDATTVTKTTTTPPPAPKPTSSATAPPPSPKNPPSPPRISITLTLPDVPIYYPNCEVAKAVGAAPIYEDEPGYREELDRNHNGIACEG